MTALPPQASAPIAAVLLRQGRRRGLFAVLAELADWGIAPVDSLPIAAGGCADDQLSRHALGLRDGLHQGQTLLQAFEGDGAFWGQRTIRVIRRHGEKRPARAFHQLARGAGESLLQRPLVSCFGISRRRSVLTATALAAFVALWLPILPHQRHRDGFVSVHFFGRHESLMQGNYNIDVAAALEADAIPTKDLDWQQGKGGRPSITLLRMLEERTGDPRIASCLISYAVILPMLANYHHLLTSLDRLAPSPVPMVWLIRRIKLERWITRKQADDVMAFTDQPEAGYARALLKLAKECPDLQPDRQ